eukprot:TRINITY_DN12202_c0_g1_i1.p1 TRINITY_DN12202_c0_g1~~TRINITY_DN12202_c0_g1_i1.p1  ORF type:complete len:610 (-),score=91.58 TRINITY_DN12202_c0_g1_i1:13-1842(-)
MHLIQRYPLPTLSRFLRAPLNLAITAQLRSVLSGYSIPRCLCSRSNDFSALGNLLAETEKTASKSLELEKKYIDLRKNLAALTKDRKFKEAEDLFYGRISEAMNHASQISPQFVQMYGLMIAAYKDNQDLRRMLLLFNAMKMRKIRADAVIYTCLLQEIGRRGDPNWAAQLFRDMLLEGVVPTVVTFNVILSILGDKEVVEKVMQRMKYFGVEPNSSTYQIVIGLYFKKDMFSEVLETFHQLKKAKLSYPPEILEMVNQAATKVGRDGEVLHEGANVDGGYREKNAMTLFNAKILNLRKKGDISGMINVCRELFRNGMRPDRYAISHLVEASGKANNTNALLYAENLMNEHSVKPDLYLYNALIEAFRRAGNQDKMMHYFKSMKRHYSPDIVTYQQILRGVQDREVHLELLDEMSNTLQPSLGFYNLKLQVYARYGLIREMLATEEQLRSMGKLDLQSIKYLVEGHGKTHHFNRCLTLFENFTEHSSKLDIQIFELIVHFCETHDNISIASRYVAKMASYDLTPSEQILISLLKGNFKEQNFIIALHIAMRMNELGYAWSDTLIGLITHLKNEQIPERLRKCFLQIRRNSASLPRITSLIKELLQEGRK